MRPFEVRVGSTEGFQHDTVIDCRWIFTFPKSRFDRSELVVRLDLLVMERIAAAIVQGLQL